MLSVVRWGLSVFLMSCTVSVLFAEDKGNTPLSRADLDSRIDAIVYEATTLGARLFNGGDPAACYRLYQGNLMAVEPLLDHRPDLQSMVKTELKRSESVANTSDRAFALRKVLDKLREELKTKPMTGSLWNRLGGEPAVRAVVREFIARAAPDPRVNISRNGKFQLKPEDVVRIEQRLVELISSVTNGPLKYTGKNMKDAHRGMGITNEEFDAAAGHLVAALKKYNVPETESNELLGIIVSTRKDIVEPSMTAPSKEPLWDRLGGELAVTAVIEDFVGRAAANPKVNFTRQGTTMEWEATPANVARLKKRLVQFVSIASGGPLKYEGLDMKSAHAGMKITDDEFNALAADLKATLDKFQVPAAEKKELMDAVGSTRSAIVEVK